MRTRTLLPALAVTATLLVTACGTSASSDDPAASDRGTGTPPTSLVAHAAGEVAVFSSPDDADAATVLAPVTEYGSPRAFLVIEQAGDWLHVLLPVRPNDASGWVRTGDVTLARTTFSVDVDLAAGALRVTDDGEVVVETPVAIGKPDAPTPPGRYYVTDVLDTPGDGPYGPYAIGLSGHSEVLTEFAGGDGRIGIHGTDDPSSIGQAVSHGCVRVPNEVITQLASILPLGTPVTIH